MPILKDHIKLDQRVTVRKVRAPTSTSWIGMSATIVGIARLQGSKDVAITVSSTLMPELAVFEPSELELSIEPSAARGKMDAADERAYDLFLTFGAAAQRALAMRLTESREYIGFSQAEVGMATGIAPSRLARMERGLHTPSEDDMVVLAALYGQTIAYLITGVKPPRVEPLLSPEQLTKISTKDRIEVERFADYLGGLVIPRFIPPNSVG